MRYPSDAGLERFGKPSIIHVVLLEVVREWGRQSRERPAARSARDDSPIFLKPIVFLVLDDMRRDGFPVEVDADFRDPKVFASLDLLDSTTVNEALHDAIAMGWIARPDAVYPNYHLTRRGYATLVDSQGLLEAYESVWRDTTRFLRAKPQPGSAIAAAKPCGRIKVHLEDSIQDYARGDILDLRNAILRRAARILLEDRVVPGYKIDKHYWAMVEHRPWGLVEGVQR